VERINGFHSSYKVAQRRFCGCSVGTADRENDICATRIPIVLLVSHRHRCLFAHVPKCAGTSIKRLLELEPVKPPYWHCAWDEAERLLGRETLASYFKFAVVRNPWDRMVSAWRMFSDKRWCKQERHHSLREFVAVSIDESIPFLTRYASHDEQVRWERSVENIRHHTLPALHPYYGVVDARGAVRMDEVINYRDLEEGFNLVRRRLGLASVRLPRENATRHKHYSCYFDHDTRAIVAEHFAADIDTFKFTFERS
jgi:chondroitin 4-sulfotransferase 11